jgi:endo-1,4-beta-D-glucanase Y
MRWFIPTGLVGASFLLACSSEGGSSAGGGGAGAGASAGAVGLSGAAGSAGGSGAAGSAGGPTAVAAFPFPQAATSSHCSYPTTAAYEDWKTATITSDGASGYLRVKKPDSGTVIGSTVSEGIGYGMLLAVYMGDQALFDSLWRYCSLYLDDQGLMHWEIGPTGQVIGTGAASDGDEDIAWALVMASRQWGGKGSLDDSYLDLAKVLIDRIWTYEVDTTRNYMLKPGDQWGDVDITNPSYFSPAYYRVFGQLTGKTADWNKVIDSSYAIISASLNATSGNLDNGLVPAWCDSNGVPVVAYAGAPTHFQHDSTRTPFRVGQDWCWFAEPRAQAYLAKLAGFYAGLGVANIVDGYNLDGTARPERAVGGLQAASFVGPAGVAFMSAPTWQTELDQAWTAVASQQLTAGTIYYQKSWTAQSLLMMAGDFVDFTASP